MTEYSPPVKAEKPKKPAKSFYEKLKPYPDFPLYAHPGGMWAKRINGKMYYFGRWGTRKAGKVEPNADTGWKQAKDLFDAQKDALYAGRTPRTTQEGGLTVGALCNRFLTAKQRKMDADELTLRSFQELKATTDRLVAAFGAKRLVEDLTAEDFEELRATLAKKKKNQASDDDKNVSPVRLFNEITRVRSVFKYAVDNIAGTQPVQYGSQFNKPDKTTRRKYRAAAGKKLFSISEVHELLKTAAPTMRAMILLGLNGGIGNTDIANMEFGHVDLETGWLDYSRTKTGIGRRVPLWPETISALKEVIANRPVPADLKADGGVVFLTPKGERFVRVFTKSRTDLITGQFAKLLKALGIGGRKNLGFYALRKTFSTIGLETGDRDAVKSLMGHAFGDVLELYDEAGPSDGRLKLVTDHVRQALAIAEAVLNTN